MARSADRHGGERFPGFLDAGMLFAPPVFAWQLVFKGGVSWSKVFGVIGRFSKDIDVSAGPAFLGICEESVVHPHGKSKPVPEGKEVIPFRGTGA
jgi:hypothetical protein